MSNTYGAGTALCNYQFSGSAGDTDVKMLESNCDPHVAIIQGVLWTGVGILTLKTHNGIKICSITQAAAATVPTVIVPNNLAVTTPILYTVTGSSAGVITMFGYFII